jgi:hypothetical protein
MNWMWKYFSYDKDRLIIGKKKGNIPVEEATQKTMV